MSYDNQSRWSYELVRTRDGSRTGRVYAAGTGSWARRIDGRSGGSHVFHLGTNPRVWARMRPARRTLVVCYDDEPVYAGVIWAATYDRNAGTVTLRHEDIWSIWERRFAVPQEDAREGGPYVIQTYRTYSGISRRTHAKRIIQMGMAGLWGPLHSYQLPITLPANEDGNWTFTYRTYNFRTVADELARISSYSGHMSVDFRPYWRANNEFAWELVVSHFPSVAKSIHVDAPESPVTSLQLTHDMSEYASESQVTGAGQGESTVQRTRFVGDIHGDFVALAKYETYSDIETGDGLNSILDGLQEVHRLATVNVDVTVALGEGGLSPHDFTIGQNVRLFINDDPIIPSQDDGHIFLLMGYTPNGAGELKLELSPVDGFTGYDAVAPTMRYRNLSASGVGSIYGGIHKAQTRLTAPIVDQNSSTGMTRRAT